MLLKFLGLILDSIRMIVSLTQKKTQKVLKLCKKVIKKKSLTIRALAGLIGNIVATLPAAQYGRLHYRKLEMFKTQSLKDNCGNWDALCSPTREEKCEIQWWIDNIESVFNPIIIPPIPVELKVLRIVGIHK